MAQVSKDPLDVSSEFIESGKILKTNSKKRGGPYSKNEKIKRQNEVNRLYFEYGYSARKISELMKINRNTINGDIDYWYSKIINTSSIDPELSVLSAIRRFNIQRSRLRESLDNADTFQQKHIIEKMIFDMDSKIINTQIKLANSEKRVHDEYTDKLNKWLKENGKNNRFLTYFDLISIFDKSLDKILKIMTEDKKKIGI